VAPSLTEERWARAAEALWRRSGDEVIVLPRHATDPIGLGHPGSEVWEVLTEPASAADVRARLGGVEEIDGLLAQLDGLRVLERRPS
jgi:hypothetical protein